MTRDNFDTSDLTPDSRFWLMSVPRVITLIGVFVVGAAMAIGGCCIAERSVHAYQLVMVAEIKAGIVQSIVDGAVAIVQTIVTGGLQ